MKYLIIILCLLVSGCGEKVIVEDQGHEIIYRGIGTTAPTNILELEEYKGSCNSAEDLVRVIKLHHNDNAIYIYEECKGGE